MEHLISPTRVQTPAPCIGRWILNHCTPGKPHEQAFFTSSTFMKSGRQDNACLLLLLGSVAAAWELNWKQIIGMPCFLCYALLYFTDTVFFTNWRPMATAAHYSNLAWRIPWIEKPGGLQSIGSQTAGHNWSDLDGTAWPPCKEQVYRCRFSNGICSLCLSVPHFAHF